MRPSMRNFSASISLLLLLGFGTVRAQSLYPSSEGGRVRCSAMIEMPRAYISGVCVMYHDGQTVKGSLFNEFGISALDFAYDTRRDRVRLLSVTDMLDKWYIRRVLRRDLRQLLHNLREGEGTYRDEKHKITYQFTLLPDDTEE